MTFLAIDIGNTRLKWAHYASPRPGAQLLAHGAEFLENIDKLADGPWASLAAPSVMLGCVVAGDAAGRRVEEQMELWDVVPRWVVANESEAGLRNGYDFPTRLGADRWVAMIGAWHRMLAQGPARPTVVAMVGTAVTVEAIDATGKFLGGLILPGPQASCCAPWSRGRPGCTYLQVRCAVSTNTASTPSPVAAPTPLLARWIAWSTTCAGTARRSPRVS